MLSVNMLSAILLTVITLSVAMLSDVMLSVVMLSVSMLNDVMLSVIMLSISLLIQIVVTQGVFMLSSCCVIMLCYCAVSLCCVIMLCHYAKCRYSKCCDKLHTPQALCDMKKQRFQKMLCFISIFFLNFK